MDNINTQKNTQGEEGIGAGMVHIILSHSYTVFFMAVIFGLVLDVFIAINIFNNPIYQYMGIVMIVLGSIVIYWAQSASSQTQKKMEKDNTVRDFEAGPYKYSRNPTHIGLSVMTLGLALLLNSVFSIALTIVASLVTKFIFLKKEENLLEKKYGQSYLDYKKKVSTWV